MLSALECACVLVTNMRFCGEMDAHATYVDGCVAVVASTFFTCHAFITSCVIVVHGWAEGPLRGAVSRGGASAPSASYCCGVAAGCGGGWRGVAGARGRCVAAFQQSGWLTDGLGRHPKENHLSHVKILNRKIKHVILVQPRLVRDERGWGGAG